MELVLYNVDHPVKLELIFTKTVNPELTSDWGSTTDSS